MKAEPNVCTSESIGMIVRALCFLAVLTPTMALAADAVTDDTAASQALRVCSDPNNLPFSNRAGQGFENHLAAVIGRALGEPVKYYWWPQRRGFIRNTLDAGHCDVVMGMPAGSELILTTRPYYISTYALVYRKDAGYDIRSLDDPILRKLKIGLHFIGDDYSNPPPAAALARRGIVKNIVGYSIYGDYREPNPPARLIEAVAKGDVDVAIAWGPLAGYFAKRQPVDLKVVPLATPISDLSTPFEYAISLGVRKRNGTLQTKLDHILDRKYGEVRDLLNKYSVPLVEGLPPPRQVSLN